MKTREPLNNHKYATNAKTLIKKKLSHHFIIFKLFKVTKLYVEYVLWKARIFIRKRNANPTTNKIYWISPDDITYCTLKEFNPFRYDGAVLNGDWDQMEKKFEELDVFIAFKYRFFYKGEWRNTQFYKNSIKKISTKQFRWGCSNEQDFVERCKRLDNLYKDIRDHGYKTQQDLQSHFCGLKSIDEISVNIGRYGDFLFNNGAHRLSIAKLLNIDKIPVRVTVCHRQLFKK